MEIPFNKQNGNLLATKSMSLLFTQIEMSEGYVEPAEDQVDYQALDQERINLIKSVFIFKLKSLIFNLQQYFTLKRSLYKAFR
jgi:hypothetical protein